MALIQALANAGALLVAQKLSYKIAPRMILWCTAGFSILNGIVAFHISDISSITLFLRLLSGALLTSFLFSQGPRILSSDVKKSNQVIQTWASVAALIGFGLAPILASSIKHLYLVDTLLNGLALGASAVFFGGINFPMFKHPEEKTPEEEPNLWGASVEKPVLYLAIVTFALWCFGGFFHVVEVPLLLQRFRLNNFQVSLIFILTITLNISSIALLNRKWVARFPWTILISSTALVGVACILYLGTRSLLTVILVVTLIGLANGAFNLSQTTMLQRIESAQTRLSSFIFVRLLAQMGLMVGALLAGSGLLFGTAEFANLTQIEKTSSPPPIRDANILIQNLPQRIEPYKNSDTGAMLVIHQIFDNLFEYDSRNNLVPNLVESLIWKNENRTLLLTLKKNISFSNGEHLNSFDVKNTLNEAKEGMGESGNWAFGQLKSLVAINEHEIEFNFFRPFTLMPAILASPYFGVFKKDKAGAIIGTGDYALESKETHQITLGKNTKNRNIPSTAPEKIYFSDKADPTVSYLISDGKVNNLTPIEFRTLQTVLFVPNLSDPVLRSKEIRCHLITEISKLAPQVYSKWKPTDLGLPFSSDLFPIMERPQSDSQLILNTPLVIHFSNSVAGFEQASNLQLSKTLLKHGFPVRFEQIPIRELIERAQKGRFSGLMFGYVPDFVHPHALVAPLLASGQTFNFGKYKNKEVDRLIELALSETDKGK
ncbi:MFS transporter [Bdellovibrionota bacterium FG-1]